jgi:2-desacetyl-2-hydroxyethyl bacteriochlorophyllide A dehydrogenase
MKAVLLTGVNEISIQEIPIPTPGLNEIVIKMLACGICGTDRHILKGEYESAKPLVMGHELGGEIISLGDFSGPGPAMSIGDVVSVDPNIICGRCFHCLNHENKSTSHCENLIALGVTINGGFAQHVLLPRSQAYVVPKNINPLYLAFVEPLACCIHGMDLAEIKGGERVCILGGGAMGMLMVQLAKLAGASEIILVTRQEARRQIALATGATRTIDPTTTNLREILNDVDVTFECAGVPETFQQSLEITRVGGTVIILGIYPSDQTLPINLYKLVTKGLKVLGSFINAFTQARAADLISSGKLNLDPLISKVIKLEEVSQVLAQAPGNGDIKYIVVGE